jgi:hypothetical protein
MGFKAVIALVCPPFLSFNSDTSPHILEMSQTLMEKS